MISKTLPSSGIKEQSTENIGGMWINTSTVWYQTDVMQPFSFLRKKTHMSYLHVAPKEVFYGNSTKVILKMKSPLILLVYFFQRMSGLSLTDLYCVRAWRLIKVNLLPLGWSLHSALWHDDMITNYAQAHNSNASSTPWKTAVFLNKSMRHDWDRGF